MPAPRNALGRNLAEALTHSRGSLAFEPSTAQMLGTVVPRELAKRAKSAAMGLPAAIIDALTLGPFSRLSQEIQAGVDQGLSPADSIDYGDLIGSTAIPAGGGALAWASRSAPRNALGMMGSKMFNVNYYDQPIRVFRNPRPEALKRFLAGTKHKAARRLTDKSTGDVYHWDAGDPALHQQMTDQLGLDRSMVDADIIGLDD